MSEIELKARELLAAEAEKDGYPETAKAYREGMFDTNPSMRALVAALAPHWQPIESAPADELVVVCWLDDEDTENPERHEFDYMEDGIWAHHANLVEHAQSVAPPGSRIPKEQAPYQWWMPLPASPEVKL